MLVLVKYLTELNKLEYDVLTTFWVVLTENWSELYNIK